MVDKSKFVPYVFKDEFYTRLVWWDGVSDRGYAVVEDIGRSPFGFPASNHTKTLASEWKPPLEDGVYVVDDPSGVMSRQVLVRVRGQWLYTVDGNPSRVDWVAVERIADVPDSWMIKK